MENPTKNNPVGNERENKETSPDFLKIFNDRLKEIKPVSDQEAKDWASWYKDPEITEITKEVPAVLFDPNNLDSMDFTPPTDIWIENPENLDMTSDYIHDQIKKRLKKFSGKNITSRLLAGYILEDGNSVRYLVLDEIRVDGMKKLIKLGGQTKSTLLDLLNKYKIKKVIEKYSEKIISGDTSSIKENSREVIGKSMLDKRREDMALINLARKYGMTNSQYLRLKILADTLFQAGKQVSLDEIARSIVKNPDGENIPVKHLPLEEEK